MTELLELIKDLWWCSEIDAPWKLETWDNLAPIESNDFNTVDFDKFFRKTTQSESWYGEQENKEVEQYQSLVQWLKNNLADLRVYKIGDVNIDIYVAGRLDSKWIVLRTKVVQT